MPPSSLIWVAVVVVVVQVVGAILKQRAEKAEAERRRQQAARLGSRPAAPSPEQRPVLLGDDGTGGTRPARRVAASGGVLRPDMPRAQIPTGRQPQSAPGASDQFSPTSAKERLQATESAGSLYQRQLSGQLQGQLPGQLPGQPQGSLERPGVRPGRQAAGHEPGVQPGSARSAGAERFPGLANADRRDDQAGDRSAKSRERRGRDQSDASARPQRQSGRGVREGEPSPTSRPSGQRPASSPQSRQGEVQSGSSGPRGPLSVTPAIASHYAQDVSPILTSQRLSIEAGAAAAMGSAGTRPPAGRGGRDAASLEGGIQALRGLLRRQASLRQAVVLSEILGPPVTQREQSGL